jgi:hypothetical protein
MKKSALIVGSINDTSGIEPKIKKLSLPMLKDFNIESTVSIYVTIMPKIISIHAASLIFGHRKIAKKAAIAPRIS